MNGKKEQFAGIQKKVMAGAALALLVVGNGAAALPARGATLSQESKEKQMTTTQSKFYCNIKALTAEERTHHKQLGDKLMAARKEVVDIGNGYEFQFSPKDVTLAEL